MGKNILAIACAYGLISIGRDALFSEDDVLQAGDGHSIFDVITEKNINSNKSERKNNLLYSADIGDHVWVGRRAIILCGMTQIGMGPIVGAMSFVKGSYPNNVSIGGIPAKILRRNIAWSHENCAEDIRSCNGYTNLTNI